MKKIILICSIVIGLCSAAAVGYNTYITYNNIPRTAATTYNPYVDNTYRQLSWTYDSLPQYNVTGIGAGDTAYIIPTTFKTIVYASVVDSFAVFISDTNAAGQYTSYRGDDIEFEFFNSTAGAEVVHFAGPNVVTSTTYNKLPITASKRANIIFHFDGTDWVEVSRMQQL
jgi:hypothetical protein